MTLECGRSIITDSQKKSIMKLIKEYNITCVSIGVSDAFYVENAHGEQDLIDSITITHICEQTLTRQVVEWINNV